LSRYRRLVVPGYPHHVTQRGVRKQTTFFDNDDFRRYLRLAKEMLEQSDIEVWAYCLMPNHVHAVVLPTTTKSLSSFFGPLHRKYARQTNQKYDWSGHLWQGRFFSVAMDEAHTVSAMRYVEMNPVRAGFCDRADDWQWSSAKANLGFATDPLVDRRSTMSVISNWDDYLNQPQDEVQVDSLRTQTMTGRPQGSPLFLRTLETISGRRVTKALSGRRPKTG